MQIAYAIAIGSVLACIGPIEAQETVENPEFTSWAKFKKGTTVSMKSINVVGGRSSEVIITFTLVDAASDKLILENSSLVKDKVKDFKSKPEKQEVLKLTQLPKGLSKADFALWKPPGTTEEGTETLKLGGLELKTKWYKYKAEVGGARLEGKRWVSDEVPINVVKSDITTTDGPGGFTSTIKMELVDFKKP
jgi:hypothetical protein